MFLTTREQVFLFADTQIKLKSFVEDINNLLNSGEVPNIFSDAAERAAEPVAERAAERAAFFATSSSSVCDTRLLCSRPTEGFRFSASLIRFLFRDDSLPSLNEDCEHMS